MGMILTQERFKEKLRGLNLKVTLPRLVIFDILKENRNHPDAETIYRIMKKQFKYISLATVYNTLRQLSRIGVIQEIALPNGIRRFDADLSLHIHLICKYCHQVGDFDNSYKDLVNDILQLRKRIKVKAGFITSNVGLFFFGVCRKCKGNLTGNM